MFLLSAKLWHMMCMGAPMVASLRQAAFVFWLIQLMLLNSGSMLLRMLTSLVLRRGHSSHRQAFPDLG